MDHVIALADQLGQAIARSPQAERLRQTRQAVESQADLLKLLHEIQNHSQKIARLEHENKPVEVEDKHHMAELQQQLASSEVFKALSSAQVEYVDMMRRINSTLQKHLADTEK